MRVVPVRECNTLELHWQVPAQPQLYPAMPLLVLGHLLGHEVGHVGNTCGLMGFVALVVLHYLLLDSAWHGIVNSVLVRCVTKRSSI